MGLGKHHYLSPFKLYVGAKAIQHRTPIGIWQYATMPDQMVETYEYRCGGDLPTMKYPGIQSLGITLQGAITGEEQEELNSLFYGQGQSPFSGNWTGQCYKQMMELVVPDGSSILLCDAFMEKLNFSEFDAEGTTMRVEISFVCDKIVRRSNGYYGLDGVDLSDEVLEGMLRSEGLTPMEIFDALTSRKP